MAKSTEQVIELVERAFDGVRLGDGIGLWQAQAIDDWWDCEQMIREGRERDEKMDWRKIDVETLNQCSSSPCFLDAEGFRFLIPAYIIAELRTGVDGEIVWLLSKRSDIIMEKFTALNRAQRLAIREFLIHVMDEPDHQDYRDEIEIALETAWADDK